MAAGVAELMDKTWEEDVARLHVAAMAGGLKDGEEAYQAMDKMCWNCRHRKLVCERPEYVFHLSLFFIYFLLIVLQLKEIVLLVHEGKKTVSHDGSRVEEAERDVRESGRQRRQMTREQTTRRRWTEVENGDS